MLAALTEPANQKNSVQQHLSTRRLIPSLTNNLKLAVLVSHHQNLGVVSIHDTEKVQTLSVAALVVRLTAKTGNSHQRPGYSFVDYLHPFETWSIPQHATW
jgi:hypothetical protein